MPAAVTAAEGGVQVNVKSPVTTADTVAHSRYPCRPGWMVIVSEDESVTLFDQVSPPVMLADNFWFTRSRMFRLVDQASVRASDVVSDVVSPDSIVSETGTSVPLTTIAEPRTKGVLGVNVTGAVAVKSLSVPCDHRFAITEAAAVESWLASIVATAGLVSTQFTWKSPPDISKVALEFT
jgi:hypothetical protein